MPQSWGPSQGRQGSLAGWTAIWTKRRAAGHLDPTHKGCTSAGLRPKQGGEGRLKAAPVAAEFPTTALARA